MRHGFTMRCGEVCILLFILCFVRKIVVWPWCIPFAVEILFSAQHTSSPEEEFTRSIRWTSVCLLSSWHPKRAMKKKRIEVGFWTRRKGGWNNAYHCPHMFTHPYAFTHFLVVDRNLVLAQVITGNMCKGGNRSDSCHARKQLTGKEKGCSAHFFFLSNLSTRTCLHFLSSFPSSSGLG